MASDILIVDDLPNWRRQLVAILSNRGYAVEAVGSSKEAKQAMASSQYKLAVIDIRLEDANESNVEGLELLEAIDATASEIKVIVMTGYWTASEEQRARQSPRFIDFINKEEFDVRRFLETVKAVISMDTAQ
jgi:DNA-binding NtrC family response regulator